MVPLPVRETFLRKSFLLFDFLSGEWYSYETLVMIHDWVTRTIIDPLLFLRPLRFHFFCCLLALWLATGNDVVLCTLCVG